MNITFTVKYRRPSQWFWRTVERVKGDSAESFLGGSHHLLILEDESLFFIPRDAEIRFSGERHKMIREQMHKESNGVVSKD